jgi:SNF2 family DNA or RNA helicase
LYIHTNMALQLGLSKLNKSQLKVHKECIAKGSGGMSLCLGFGKTLLSLVVALEQTKKLSNDKILVVVSKTLIQSWVFEIKKFFGDKLKFIVFHQENVNLTNFVFTDEKVILTTPEVLTKFYKLDNISDVFQKEKIINPGQFGEHTIIEYAKPTRPFGHSELFKIKWGCIIIDEAQVYTKISSLRCKSISSLCATNRWVTSGTLFDEPTIERILGYHLIINHPTFPRTLPDAEKLIKSNSFKGINQTVVSRKNNELFIKPKVNEYIICNDLIDEEKLIYLSMKDIIKVIGDKIRELKRNNGDETATNEIRKYNSYLLAMLIYLRQSIICPIIPIANVALDITGLNNKSELSIILSSKIKSLGIDSFLNSTASVKSSRIVSVLNVVNNHKNDNIVLFTCFRSCLDLIHAFLPGDRKVLTITSDLTSEQRSDVIEEFKNGKNSIMLLTYSIGAVGLNLQCSNTVLLSDFYWNDGKTQQAIGRVLRYGQTAKEVNVYYFTSNTGVEKAIFKKQDEKLIILDEINSGAMVSKIKKLNVMDIISIIEKEDNIAAIENIKNKHK